MTRVLHLIVGLGAGGAEAMLERLVTRMDRTRFETTVISMTDRGVHGDAIERAGVDVLTLGMRRGTPDPRAFLRLRRILRERRPDLIQSWMYHADVLAAVVAPRERIPLLWNVRGAEIDFRDASLVTHLTRRVAARLSGRPAGVVVNSTAGRIHHESLGYRPREWHLIPNGFDVERFKPDPDARRDVRAELGAGEATPLVGMIGRFDPLKDHATFLAAAKEIAARRPEVQFVLAGFGCTPANRALVGPNVHLLGHRTDPERVMAALDVHVLSSYSEGFPNVVGEAMACGVVCVATDVGDAATIIGDTGVVVPRRDPRALAEGVLSMLELSPSARRELGARARTRIEREYSLEATVRRYEELYARVAR